MLIGAADRQDKIGDVLALAKDDKETVAVRQAAVEALGAIPTEPAVEVLDQLVNVEQPTLRTAVIQALGPSAQQRPRKGGADLGPAVQVLQKLVLGKERDLAVRHEAALVLANTRIGNEWAEIDAGKGLVIGLHPAHEGTAKPGDVGAINIELAVTKPLEDVVADIVKAKATVGPIANWPDVRLVAVEDPDRNAIMLAQVLHH